MLSRLMQWHIALVILQELSEGTLALKTGLLFIFPSVSDVLLAC